MLCDFLLPSRLEWWRYHLDPLICNPPYCSSPLPYTRNRRFTTPLQATTTTSQLTLKAYHSPSGSHALVSEQPYTKYLYTSSGYLRRFCSFDGGDNDRIVFRASWCLSFRSPLPVKTQIASVNIIAYTLAAQSHGFPPPPSLSLKSSRLSSVFPFLCVAWGRIRSCSCRWAADRVLLLSLSLM